MKATSRFFFSAATGLGLSAFTAVSAFIAGVNSPITTIAFSLLAIYGLLEIAILSYASPRFEVRPSVSSERPKLTVLPAVDPALSVRRVSARETERRAA